MSMFVSNPYAVLAAPNYVVPEDADIPKEAFQEYAIILRLFPNLFPVLLLGDRKYIDSDYFRELLVNKYESDYEYAMEVPGGIRKMMCWNRCLLEEGYEK